MDDALIHPKEDTSILLQMTCKKKKATTYWKKVKMGKIIIKGATQANGHSLKLYFFMFEKSQRKHNSLDCHNNFWNIFH
jgi:hypothetical protein